MKDYELTYKIVVDVGDEATREDIEEAGREYLTSGAVKEIEPVEIVVIDEDEMADEHDMPEWIRVGAEVWAWSGSADVRPIKTTVKTVEGASVQTELSRSFTLRPDGQLVDKFAVLWLYSGDEPSIAPVIEHYRMLDDGWQAARALDRWRSAGGKQDDLLDSVVSFVDKYRHRVQR